MKLILSILLTAILCSTASAQTIKTLGYNSTNGQVVANTGTNVLTFTNSLVLFGAELTISNNILTGPVNSLSFEDGAFTGSLYMDGGNIQFSSATNAATTRANLGFSTNLNTLWTATNASNARSAVGLGATWLTNTNVSNFTAAIGLGQSNGPTFLGLTVSDLANTNSTDHVAWVDDTGTFFSINAAATRDNLLLGLSALTNTSNVTIMRALSGSTNTNHPYSGSISVVGTNNTNTLVFSNGILQSVQ